MKVLDFKALSNDYARYHTHPLNRACHILGIPMIVFCVVRWTQFGTPFPAAGVALVLYAFWDVNLAIVMGAVMAAMALAAPLVSFWGIWAIFILGWFFQFAGHEFFEKKSPAFTKNLIHVLVWPMWILAEVLGPDRA